MTTEEQILKTLQDINKVLRESSGATRGVAGGGSDKTTVRATGKSKTDQHLQATTKSLDRLSVAAITSSKAMLNFALRTQIGAKNLSAFNKAVGAFGKDTEKTAAKPNLSAKGREQQKRENDKLFSMFRETFKNSVFTVNVKGGVGSTPKGKSVEEEGITEPGNKKKTKSFGEKTTSFFTDFFTQNKDRLLNNIDQAINTLFKDVVGRGIGASSFFELSLDAAKAGMSLRDYTAMLQENAGVMSRYGTFGEFDQALSKTSNKLAGLGIFGEDATKLSAAMMSSSQSLGIPMDKLSDTTSAQVKVFEELRKTTGMTADGFNSLIRSLQENEVVQKELLGLAPAERAARQQQLLQTMSWGKQLGLTDEAAARLTNALIEQRKTTVKQRFEQRGRLTQAMSLVGMDPGAIAEAATLAGKRMKTPEEERRFTELMGEYAQRTEEIKQTGGEGMQFQAETAEDFVRNAGLGGMMDAAAGVKLAQDSGAQVQKELGKSNEYLQGIGKVLGVLEGTAKNELVKIGLGIVGIAGLLLGLPQRIGVAVASAMKGLGGGGGIGVPDVPDTGGKGGKWGKVAGIASKVVAVAGVAAAAIGAVSDYANAEETAKREGKSTAEVKGGAIGEGLGTAAGGMIGTAIASALAPFTGGLSLLLTPLLQIGGAFAGGWIGKWYGALVGSKVSTEKNTAEIDKQTAEMIATRRATAGSTVVSANDLGSLNQNLVKTAAAYATVQGQPEAAQVMPIQPIAKTVAPADVNTQETVEQRATAAAAAKAIGTTPGPATAQDVLSQILQVLQKSLLTEEQQVAIAQQMLLRTSGSKITSDVTTDGARVLKNTA